MTWYAIVLIVSGALFLFSTIGSLFFGDVDIDLDSDLDASSGFTVSDIISFKGLLHFTLGFSLILTLIQEVTLISVCAAVIAGLIFVFALFYLYKFIYVKLPQNMTYIDEIKEMDAEVYFWNENQKIGEVFITMEGRPTTVTMQGAEGLELEKGQKIKVSGTRKLVFPVK
jgi:hypothetical protein